MKKILIILFSGFVLAFASCTTHLGSFTVISSKKLDLRKKYTPVQGEIDAEASYPIVSIIPLVPREGLFNQALKNAEDENGIDYIGGAEVESSGWYIPFIYGKITLHIRGKGYKQK